MALTVCFRCDKSYGERSESCPHCGCFNYYCDEDTMIPAVHMLCDELNARAEQDKKEKLRELWWDNFWRNPPWWMRWINWMRSL